MFLFVFIAICFLGVAAQEKQEFDVEVSKLMNIIINSLYTNKEVFLRELISNASDAIEKVRFSALTNKELNIDSTGLKIRISVDSEKGTITIADNGVGMTKEELGKNLGTIAKSGTSEFIKKLEESNDKQLIG